MLVICEDCAKKYNIDESRIKGNRARFTCNECGHIIIVDKTDLSRPLVGTAHHDTQPSSSSVDLLKEMNSPLVKEGLNKEKESTEQEVQEKTEPAPEKNAEKEKTLKGMTIPGYFLLGGALSFLLVNGGVGYILSQHYAKISGEQMELHSDMFLTAGVVLLGTWAVSFAALFVIGLLLAQKVKGLTSAITRITHGEKDVKIQPKGPRELVGMSKALTELYRKSQ